MRNKTIYVIGGTNGVGKSTIADELLKKDIPYINADLIARKMKGQQPGYIHNEVARQIGSEQIKKHIDSGESFAFESNLNDKETYKWLQEMQQDGYRIELYYIGVDNLDITIKRIEERVKRGEHHVPKNEVFVRYENGIKLLTRFYSLPDKLFLIDNSMKHSLGLTLEKGKVVQHQENAPAWIKEFGDSLKQEQKLSVASLKSIEDVRNAYEQLKQHAGMHNQTNSEKNKKEEQGKKIVKENLLKRNNKKGLRPPKH